METLDSWYKEYRAYQQVELERPKIELLNQLETELLQTEQGLGELQARLDKLLEHSEQTLQAQQQESTLCYQQLENLQKDWEQQELQLKSALATTKADLEQAQRQTKLLDKERLDWDAQAIADQQQLYANLDQIKTALKLERDNRAQLMADVQDIEAEFRRLHAEKEQYFAEQIHQFALAKQQAKQLFVEQQAQATAEFTERKDNLRELSEIQQEQNRQLTLQLSEQLGAINSQITQVQADPVLLEDRETKLELHASFLLQHQTAEANEQSVKEAVQAHKADVERVFQLKRQYAEDKQALLAQQEQLSQQINADAATLLGFLREYKPDWGEHIAKVIQPDLLLREDLEPELLANQNSLYGIGLQLATVDADNTLDEDQLRQTAQDLQEKIEQVSTAEKDLANELQQLSKTDIGLQKQVKQAALVKGQLSKQLDTLKEELESLKQQIARSKTERAAQLQQQRMALNGQIQSNNTQLVKLKQQLADETQAIALVLSEKIAQAQNQAVQVEAQAESEIARLTTQKADELAALNQQRLQSMQERKVDTAILTALDNKIQSLTDEQTAAENAEHIVHQYQRWLDNDWARYDDLSNIITQHKNSLQQQQQQYDTLLARYQQERVTQEEQLTQLKASIKKYDKEINTLKKVLDDLSSYPKKIPETVSFDSSHRLPLLQGHYQILSAKHKTQRKELADLVRHLKRVLAAIPDTRPHSYYAAINTELGVESDDLQWVPALQEWFTLSADDTRRWLVMQAQTFGSAIRNYQQALQRFDRGIDSLSRRLAAHIDQNIRFEKIESIQGRLSSKVKTLGYWEQIVKFTEHYDEWNRNTEGKLPADDFANIVRQVADQLQSKNKIEMKLVNLLELEIIVTENGRSKKATRAEELRQISSHGLSYLILCVFFIALINMIRKDQEISFIWPMDELKELHQLNIELLIDILSKNNITLLSAFPDPDPEILCLFKNRYQVHGFRELIEMQVDADYMANLETLAYELDAPVITENEEPTDV
jgi:hypothetical protein